MTGENYRQPNALFVDPDLKAWATERQGEFVDAVNLHGSATRAAAVLGVNKSVISRSIASLKKRAATQGYSPDHGMDRVVPEPYVVRGHSTLDRIDPATGERSQILQWTKTSLDDQKRQELQRAAYEALAAELPRVSPAAAPEDTLAALCNLYIMTDCHMGMLAWHREGGEDWDITIAEHTLSGCFLSMLERAPPARVGFIAQLGDFLHYDGLTPVTPTSGHILDADSRFTKMVEATVRTLRRLVDAALVKHEQVVVLMAEGNHDMASSVWLRVMFKALYENEPRIEVIDSALPYYAYRHGRTLLGFHHSHLKRMDGLPLLFAAQFPEMWGGTAKRYIHTGDKHHERMQEHPGVKVIQHPTLAARDAYAARGGWLSERQASAITYHEEHGQVATTTVIPEMLG